MEKPELTVVIPVYNGEKYLAEAIDSVLDQSFENFELLMINDGSTDGSASIISSYKDPRIRTLTNETNMGIPYNRNLGLKEARGEFLCWTDCDDLNMRDRFEKQIRFLKNNSSYGGCGTWLSRFKGSRTYYKNKALENPAEIKAALLFRPATIPNATAMLRLGKIRQHDIWYNTELPISEDYDFIFRCSRHLKFSNIPEVLYKYRDSETSIMKRFENLDKKRYEIQKTIFTQALNELEMEVSEANLRFHYLASSEIIFDTFDNYKACYMWMQKLRSANEIKEVYDEKALDSVLAAQFFYISKKASRFGLTTLLFFIRKLRENGWPVKFTHLSKLSVRCLLKYDKFEFGIG